MHEKIYQIALSLLNGIGPKKAKTLVSYIGSAQGVFEEKLTAMAKIPGIGSQILKSINTSECIDRALIEYDFIQKNDIQTHYYQDNAYPQKLTQCDDGPIILFSKGNIDFNKKKSIAVVGTRKASGYGKEMTQQFVQDLKNSNVQIVSGLAFGIDIAAHQAAIECDMPTIGVLAHGLDDLYPMSHKPIAEKMVKHSGALVSEFISKTNADGFVRHYPN